jgi:hypothetical protein
MNLRHRHCIWVLAFLAGFSPTLSICAAQQNATNAKPVTTATATQAPKTATEIPKSMFVFDPKSSRDPFFPNWRPIGQVVAPTNQMVVPTGVPLDLKLRGISGAPGHRIALINNRAMFPGEEADFKTPDGKTVSVRCTEVHEQSAVVILSGGAERRVLSLASDKKELNK